jgi:hypothetical protein
VKYYKYLNVILFNILINSNAYADCETILKHGIFDETTFQKNSNFISQTQQLYCRNISHSEQKSTSDNLSIGAVVKAIPIKLAMSLNRDESSLTTEQMCKYDWAKLEFTDKDFASFKIVNADIVKSWETCMKNEIFSFSFRKSPDNKKVTLESKLNKPIRSKENAVLLESGENGRPLKITPENALKCSEKDLSGMYTDYGQSITCEISDKYGQQDVVIDLNTNYGNKTVVISPPPTPIQAPIFDKPARSTIIEVSNTMKSKQGWQEAKCASGFFIEGFKMQSEPPQGKNDDTAANMFAISCINRFGNVEPLKKPVEGLFGKWGTHITKCQRGTYVSSYSINNEPHRGNGNDFDDTAVNWLKFGCRSFNTVSAAKELTIPHVELIKEHNWPTFGIYGEPAYCPAYTAACGLRVKVEGKQKGGDDISLYDVALECCDASELLGLE